MQTVIFTYRARLAVDGNIVEQVQAHFVAQQQLLEQAGSITLEQQDIVDRQGNKQSMAVLNLGAVTSVALGDDSDQAGLIDQVGAVQRVAGPLLSLEQQAAGSALPQVTVD